MRKSSPYRPTAATRWGPAASSAMTQVSAKLVPSPERPPVIDTPSKTPPARPRAKSEPLTFKPSESTNTWRNEASFNSLRELLADVAARLRLTNRSRGGPESRMFEVDNGGNHRVVDDHVA